MHKKVFWLVAVLALLSPSVGIAAPLIGQKDTFLATDSGGASFRCASVKSQKVYVIKKGAFYVPASTLVAALQSRVNGATSAALKKKLKTKLTVLKLEIRGRNKICASPPQVNTPTPTATPTLQPTPNNPNPTVPQSLEKLDRQVTEADVVNLVDKAGFGMGSDEARLIAIGVNQGIDALVDEFMRTREESAGLATRVDERLDGQIGKSSTQTPTGQRQGILDIWLHTRNQ